MRVYLCSKSKTLFYIKPYLLELFVFVKCFVYPVDMGERMNHRHLLKSVENSTMMAFTH